MQNSQIRSFFGINDDFLNVQFDHAQGLSTVEDVMLSHASLISFTKALQFEQANLEMAKQKWLNLLGGLTVNLGFPQFKKLPKSQDEWGPYLEDARFKLGDTDFVGMLEPFANLEFDPTGTGLEVSPETWLKDNDVAVAGSVDPHLFKQKLFAATGFHSNGMEYRFSPSKFGGFFMMALHLTPMICIGYGPLDSLFRLSTFAHELGHSTTAREPDLQKLFLTFPDGQDGKFLVNEEDDSYLYEKHFMKYASRILEELNVEFEGDAGKLLAKRKAIQYNLHLLSNALNHMFFSMSSLSVISKQFAKQMIKILPDFQVETDFSWLKYATLDKPLSKLGYLKAYRKNFL